MTVEDAFMTISELHPGETFINPADIATVWILPGGNSAIAVPAAHHIAVALDDGELWVAGDLTEVIPVKYKALPV